MKISQTIVNLLIAHAKADLPNEACGYLAGVDGAVKMHFPMTNLDARPDHFTFDPKEQFAIFKEAQTHGWRLIGTYHSHPETLARPSVEDIALAYDPNLIYMIISLCEPTPDAKAFRIAKGVVTPEPIEVTP